MDLNKLNMIGKMEHQPAKRQNEKPVHHAEQKPKARKPKVSKPRQSKKVTTSKPKDYSNIRISRDVSNRLGALKQVTGYNSRSALLDEMLNIVKPVLLNSGNKERKFKHDLRLIVKKQKLLAELKQQM